MLLASFGGSFGVPLVAGIRDGCIYGMVAIGLVLIYKSNRIFNFAQAEFGSVGAFIALAFIKPLGGFPKLPYAVALILGLVASAGTGLLTERLVIRRLFNASRAVLLVATAGVALFLISAEAVILGIQDLRVFPRVATGTHYAFFGPPGGGDSFTYGWTEIDIVVGLLLLGALGVWFFRTRWGKSILAVSQDATAARAVGINVNRVSALTWGLAGLLGGAAGILYAPYKGAVPPGFMTGIGEFGPLVFGFIAAVIGGMTSLPGAFAGGLAVGIIGDFAEKYMPTSVPGGEQVVLATLLLLVLLVRPSGLLGREA
ncbi:MAG TPA: branched-chain amino acid ABC transporter permease [Acidimicrobiales bacterium]|nr:branched-chain amino acid ABC transporter permease [Acidimicrobiales bacterium]